MTLLTTNKFLHFPFLHYSKPIKSLPIQTRLKLTSMGSNSSESNSEILHEFLYFNVHKNGHINLFTPPFTKLPPIDDPLTGVKISDVQISDHLSVRIFHPPSTTTTKLPLLLYIHGGAFLTQSAFSIEYTNLLTRLVVAGNLIAVSVEYSLFPSKSISFSYEDSFTALQWLHKNDAVPHLKNADLNNLYIAGDSAGGNICHNLAVRCSPGVKLSGIILIHPYFMEGDKMWMYMCRENEGCRDRRMYPHVEDLARITCGRVLVVLGEKDFLRSGGQYYVDLLVESGWKGKLEIMENKDKDHCFHLSNPNDLEALAIQNRIISFIHS